MDKKLFCGESLVKKVPGVLQVLLTPFGAGGDSGHHQHSRHAGEQQPDLRHFLFPRVAGHERQEPLTIRFQQDLDSSAHGYGFAREFRSERGAYASSSRRIRVARAQIALDDRSQSLSFARELCSLDHAVSRFLECASYRLHKQVVLALEMPIEASLGEAGLFHDSPDPAAVPAVFAKQASGKSKNVFAALRFVLGRVSHGPKSTLVLFVMSRRKGPFSSRLGGNCSR